MKLSIKDFSSTCDEILRELRIWLHLLEKSLIENFIFCRMTYFMETPHGTINPFHPNVPVQYSLKS